MFLVIFTSLLGSGTVHLGDIAVKESTFYVASMSSFAVITACFNNIALGMTAQRDAGVLKRTNGTPLPAASFLASRVLHAVLVAVLLVALTAAFGRLAYGASLPTGMALLQFLVMLLVGAATFCALGMALAGFIPNVDASAAVVNAIILPLLFLSGIFIAFGNSTPSWVLWVRASSPSAISPSGCSPVSSALPFTGATWRWWRLGGSPDCCSQCVTSRGSPAGDRAFAPSHFSGPRASRQAAGAHS